MIRPRRLFTLLLIFLLSCANPPALQTPPPPPPVSTALSTPAPTFAAPPRTSSPHILRLWLPPQFDPNGGTPAGYLLKSRLDEFAAHHPEIRLDIRLKTNLLESLALTRAAAPDALPDLVALSHADLEAAALKGFIHPLSGLTELPYDPDWYPYARQLALIQNTPYGLTFAGDALVLVYHPSRVAEPPASWRSLFDQAIPLALPGADPTALFVLNDYLSLGGNLLDERNHPTLEKQALSSTLLFLAEGIQRGVFPASILSYASDLDVWQAFQRGESPAAILWLSQFLQQPGEDMALLPLMGADDAPHTLSTGWLWALAGTTPENQPLAAELAAWLVESPYLASWTEAAGYLPARPSALAGRVDQSLRPHLAEIADSAHPVPSAELLEALGPLLQGAFRRLVVGESPDAVLEETLNALP